MKRLSFILMVSLLLTVSVGIPASADLKLWQFFGTGSATKTLETASKEPDTFYAIVRAAEKESGISVKTVQIDWENYYTIFNQALESHNAGDIDIMHVQYLMPYVKAGLVANLSKLEKATGIYLDKIIEPQLLQATSYKGSIYAVRWDIHAFLWHINKVEFAKAGLLDKNGNPIIPNSPQEFIEEARKYKKATGQPFVYMDSGESCAWTFYSWLLQNGGKFLSDDGWEAAFDTQAGLQVLDFMTKLCQEKLANFSLSNPDACSGFVNGRVASIFHGTWQENVFNASLGKNLYTTNLPTLYHVSEPAVWSNSHSFVIPAYLPLNRQIEAYKFLISMLKYNLYWGNTGHLPVVQLSQQDLNYLLNLPNRRIYYHPLLKEARPLTQPFAGDPWAELLPYMQKTFLGKATPSEALHDAAKALNKFISQQK